MAYHAMMARLHITFSKQQATLTSMASPASPGLDAQREPMVVRQRMLIKSSDCFSRCSLQELLGRALTHLLLANVSVRQERNPSFCSFLAGPAPLLSSDCKQAMVQPQV